MKTFDLKKSEWVALCLWRHLTFESSCVIQAKQEMYSSFLHYCFQSLGFVGILLQGFDKSNLIWVHIISSSIHTITLTCRLLKVLVFVCILAACWWSKKFMESGLELWQTTGNLFKGMHSQVTQFFINTLESTQRTRELYCVVTASLSSSTRSHLSITIVIFN